MLWLRDARVPDDSSAGCCLSDDLRTTGAAGGLVIVGAARCALDDVRSACLVKSDADDRTGTDTGACLSALDDDDAPAAAGVVRTTDDDGGAAPVGKCPGCDVDLDNAVGVVVKPDGCKYALSPLGVGTVTECWYCPSPRAAVVGAAADEGALFVLVLRVSAVGFVVAATTGGGGDDGGVVSSFFSDARRSFQPENENDGRRSFFFTGASVSCAAAAASASAENSDDELVRPSENDPLRREDGKIFLMPE